MYKLMLYTAPNGLSITVEYIHLFCLSPSNAFLLNHGRSYINLIKCHELGQFMVPTKSTAATLHFIDLDLAVYVYGLFYVFN